MKCIVTGGNVKALGKAVHSLSRIGDEIYVEPLQEGLSLRTVNASRSAYACFLFAPLFFQHYQVGESGSDSDAGGFRCKVLMKSFLAVFRSLPTLEKTVEKCLILLSSRASRFRVQLHCKYGVVKTHDLSFQECESLQAVFDTGQCAHALRAPPRLLADAVVHFPLTLAEVTLAASPAGKVTFCSYLEEETEPSRMMVTELCLSEDEFQAFHVKEETQVTFCLKEFRGLLSFAESSNLPLNIHFDIPGRPAIFTVEDPVLDVHLVLATLSEPDRESSQKTSSTPKPFAPAYDFTSDDMDAYMIAMETTGDGAERAEAPPSPTFPTRRTNSDTRESESDHEGTVPGTPPQKRFRSLFFGSVLSPSQTLVYPSSSQEVLAEDSEGEA
ncbi:cell cycle checkpoint control protein RAD9A [Rhineura floridana]|uniref:cell cycle checkpoint control protein RAD9A n=1 Tax=Rhineura floridana TaxID=261503 RepID=UPI002AC8932F|nr:cell cycle checkpoint control protein RAD9A [Rhineura floridana]XP_061465513.1 cell cycle checkpoint control protein RAD9A [Rhineura floridana]XP_061465514.1 cell cycle checkpoint control protein RAD9A [Rhineura floridana]XP_061465515.1 cell cycle checkpoint control protein RAD9A [Rhineura floridana]